ncbi:rhodanese-like domain-containing protein [Lactococcus termiticola]|nr:rhodanese-like domain-containing protein [Lactococcus termiticola]
MKTISTHELLKLLPEKPHLVDVREDSEFSDGHIKEAKNAPLSKFKLGMFKKDEPNYIICRSGGRSMKACEFLEANGYEVVNIDGGMMAWNGEISHD